MRVNRLRSPGRRARQGPPRVGQCFRAWGTPAVVCSTLILASTGIRGSEPTAAGDAPPARPAVVLSDAALALHRQCLVIDGHNDLPWKLRTTAGSSFEQADISEPQPEFHTDIPRLRAGGVGAQFWSVYVPTEARELNQAAHQVLEQIDLIERMAERYPETFELARSADDIVRIQKSGKIAALIGMEGGHAIENSLSLLRMFYNLGARYMTLTHSVTLDWADSATDQVRHNGLTPFGEEVVQCMNDLGMLVDISHVSPATMDDVLRVSRAAVIASHSSASGVAPHPRNVPDDMLKRIAKNGGVVMVNFYSAYVVPESAARMQNMFEVRRELRKVHPDDAGFAKALKEWQKQNPVEPGTIHDVIDHIDHIVRVAGIDHVGLGSDYDGVPTLPAQLEDVSCYPYVTQALLDRGYPPEAIRKILGENLLRVFRDAERRATER